MSILDNLPHVCDVLERRRVSGSMGGSRDTSVVTQTDVACWRQFAQAAEVTFYQKRGIAVTDKIYFTADPQVTAQNYILIDGDIFEVRAAAKPDASAGLGVVFKVMAEEVSSIS